MPSKLTLTVTGMTCGGCENAVKRALSMLDGVDEVTASHASNTVSVTHDPGRAPVEAIQQKIEALGYHVQA
ncbi:MAG: heavy-metal-associated domain-containing protein [Vicinamibacterales bacterium]